MARNAHKFVVSLVTWASLTLSCAGAGTDLTARAGPNSPVWPPAPDPPRLQYLGNIREPRDIGQEPSVFTRVGHWLTGSASENLSLQKPFGLALDEAGNLCITDTGTGRIHYCDFAHKKWRSFELPGKARISAPVAIARRGGIFYVADSELAKVIAFRENGRLVWEISKPLRRPVGLVLTQDALAVVDSQTHAVWLFDLEGHLRFHFGQRGIGPGEFNFPTHIAIDREAHLIVTDSMNCRVQIFDREGKFLLQFGSNGDTSGHFSRPKGVAVDTFGHIYVADALFDNLQIFDQGGRFLLNLGKSGTGPGEFGLPAGLAMGSDNKLYVADGYNRRVQVFKYIGPP